MEPMLNKQEICIEKKVLPNGLTVLVYPIATIPKVACQLWYGVGSKHEREGQRGLAHLLEHMVFKGTKRLSESDINTITHKLSGSCNAFTSHDYTGYLFTLPSQNWAVSLDVLADCMRNCTFKSDLLTTELKAVVQELKMYHDDYKTTLCENMLTAIFAGHPYHYPIIGYKQDLWNITQQGLLDFYHKQYVPNNATLIIVGDVVPQDAFAEAEKAFGHIQADPTFTQQKFFRNKDIVAQSVTLLRDVQQPMLSFAFAVPGLRERQEYLIDIACYLLAEGKGSFLYKKLVEDTQLATDVYMEKYDLFEESVLFIHVDPADAESIEKIEHIVAQEVARVAREGVTLEQLQRAVALAHMDYAGVFEDIQKIAHALGKWYLATGNEQELFLYGKDQERLQERVKQFFTEYCYESVMHKGVVLPLSEQEKLQWLHLQEESDLLDEKILSRKVRESKVEVGSYVQQVVAKPIPKFNFPQPQTKILKNGLKLLWYSSALSEKVEILLRFKAQYYDDAWDTQGLYNFMCAVMTEGTQKFPGQAFADALESRGMMLTVQPGILSLTVLKQDLIFGLELLGQMLMHATFEDDQIEKVRQQLETEIAIFWDTPEEFVMQLAKEKIYKKHPYGKNILGTPEVIRAITREQVVDCYTTFISPEGAQLAIVGDVSCIDLPAAVEKAFGDWNNPAIADTVFIPLAPVSSEEIEYPINRDQTILAFAGLSVSRLDPDFDLLLLLDQVLTGGVLDSSNSYLFQLREQTGLFYTIGGSLVLAADEQPGMVFIRTIVSNDSVTQSEHLIAKTLQSAADMLKPIELEEAKQALINSLVDNFESHGMIASAFLFIDRFNLPHTYFETRAQDLARITLDQVRSIGRKVLNSENLIILQVGRLD
jgi:zinc protease